MKSTCHDAAHCDITFRSEFRQKAAAMGLSTMIKRLIHVSSVKNLLFAPMPFTISLMYVETVMVPGLIPVGPQLKCKFSMKKHQEAPGRTTLCSMSERWFLNQLSTAPVTPVSSLWNNVDSTCIQRRHWISIDVVSTLCDRWVLPLLSPLVQRHCNIEGAPFEQKRFTPSHYPS